MTDIDIRELLAKHSEISPIDYCAKHWVPEGKPLDWYLGFLQAVEIQRGVRELFALNVQPKAYEALAQCIREQLLKFAVEPMSESQSDATTPQKSEEQVLQT